MSGRPTIVTVAQVAGVSTSTVSQVLRGSGRISEQTRKKVMAAVKKTKYQRDHHAAAMRSKEFKEIGLLINRIANPFNAEVIAGVSDRLEKNGYLVFVLDTRNQLDRQKRYLETLIRGARGGLLWVPALNTDKHIIDSVIAQNIPTVIFLRQLPGGHFDQVGIENMSGTHDATEHLADLGHSHIAFLGGVSRTHVLKQRIAGYESVLKERNLAASIVWPCIQTKEGGLDAVKLLMDKHPQVTGIVCSGDVVAMGATLGLARLGKRVGIDVSVVGFDGTEEAKLWTPPLTTMTVDAFGLGENLAQALLDRIANPEAPVKSTNLSAKLVVRNTTGQAPKNQT